MPTVTLAPVDREPIMWLTPSPLWEQEPEGPGGGTVAPRPQLVELATDDFIPSFLAMLSGDDPAGPGALADHAPQDGAGTATDPIVLYQPIHLRYYLVVGSLVCRRIGLPDRTVAPRGQRVTFVVRRLGPGGEEAWIAADGRHVALDDPTRLAPGEEQHAMHTAPIGVAMATGPAAHLLGLDEPGRRQLHFGYVPVAGRSARPQPLADPLGALAADPDRMPGDDVRLMEFRIRVAGPWSDLAAKVALNAGLDIAEPSLYLLLDLRDWLSKYLPAVLTALVNGTSLPGGTKAEALRDSLDIDVRADGVARRLGTALADLADDLPLLRGVGTEPATAYDVVRQLGTAPTQALVTTLNGSGESGGGQILDALVDPAAPGAAAQVPPELAGQIVARSAEPAATSDRHVLRLVYEHEPCDPILSDPSAVMRFAGVYDSDAPARPVRIELPDPDQLRRFSRGVAIDMPPSLRRILDSVTPAILKDEGIDQQGGWQLGMICSFSLQIIMLVAFIVMFIFLLLLNIVFWWMPFLKICFPVPMKKDSP